MHRTSVSSDAFFNRGVSTAFLKDSGNIPCFSEVLTIIVIMGSISARHSFKRKVGIGSNVHDFVGDLRIILQISSGVAGLKVWSLLLGLELWHSSFGVMKICWILIIFSMKKITNLIR